MSLLFTPDDNKDDALLMWTWVVTGWSDAKEAWSGCEGLEGRLEVLVKWWEEERALSGWCEACGALEGLCCRRRMEGKGSWWKVKGVEVLLSEGGRAVDAVRFWCGWRCVIGEYFKGVGGRVDAECSKLWSGWMV